MKAPKILLRFAALLMLFHAGGHIIGQSGWSKSTNPLHQQVVHEMTGHQFLFMGVMRSMGDYFDGYGNALTVSLILFAVSLWLLSGELLASSLAKKLALGLAVALGAWAADEFVFIFPFAAWITTLATLCTFTGWLMAVQTSKKIQLT